MKNILLTTTVLASCPFLAQAEAVKEKPKTERPNIVIINIDDMGWTDPSFQGGGYYETLNIDKLRAQSVFFSNGYACAANSAPARACLMSGMYTPRHGIYTVNRTDQGLEKDRKLITPENTKHLADEFITLSERLKEVGYQTAHVGKWHLGDDPLTQGMDVNIGGNASGHPKSYFSPYKNPNLKDGPDGEYLTDRLAMDLVDYLENVDRDKPFFVHYTPYAVHSPLQVPTVLVEKYRNKEATKAHDNPKYAALVEVMDRNVGRVIDAIDSLNMRKNTIIIFTTDNGGVYQNSKQWPLRAGKGSFYEGGIRVPILISWSGVTEDNTTSEIPVSQIDFYPTILDMAGYDREKEGYEFQVEDGVSLVPLLTSDESMDVESRSLFWHFPAYLPKGNSETTDAIFRSRPVSVIRNGDWKMIRNIETGIVELYNIKEDISEKCDLAGTELEIVKKLTNSLDNWLVSTKAAMPILK